MLHALLVVAAEESEPSKVPFYVLGGGLAVWAVLLGLIGMTRPDFPGSAGAARGVMGITGVLMVGAMAAAVITS